MTGLFLFLLATAEQPIATDRPGNANAATTVPALRLQIEASLLYALGLHTGRDDHLVSFPTLFRLGLFPGLELRLSSAVAGVDATGPGGPTVHATDTSIGTKVQVLQNEGPKPDLALMIDVSLPSGTGSFTSGVVGPDARIAVSWALPCELALLVNAGVLVPNDDTGRFVQLLYAVNLAYGVGAGVTLFVESFGQIALATGRDDVVQIDAGASYLVSDDLQLDFYTQQALTAASPDFQLSIGVSGRIPLGSASKKEQ